MSALLGLGAPPLVADFAVLPIGAAILGYVCQRIGLETIVGFLIAGAIFGPNALGVIKDPELVEAMGEIGVFRRSRPVGVCTCRTVPLSRDGRSAGVALFCPAVGSSRDGSRDAAPTRGMGVNATAHRPVLGYRFRAAHGSRRNVAPWRSRSEGVSN